MILQFWTLFLTAWYPSLSEVELLSSYFGTPHFLTKNKKINNPERWFSQKEIQVKKTPKDLYDFMSFSYFYLKALLNHISKGYLDLMSL